MHVRSVSSLPASCNSMTRLASRHIPFVVFCPNPRAAQIIFRFTKPVSSLSYKMTCQISGQTDALHALHADVRVATLYALVGFVWRKAKELAAEC
eukprot:scaffold10316_cov18-Tisochrysis_lutea.AAC.2